MVDTIVLESGRKVKVIETEDASQKCISCNKLHKKTYHVDNKVLCFFCFAWYGWFSNVAGMPGPLEVKEREVKADGTIIHRTESKAQKLLELDKISKEQFDTFNTLYATDRKKARKFLRGAARKHCKEEVRELVTA